MAIAVRLLGSGVPPQAAVNTVGDVASGLTATGTVITDAYDLTAVNSHFSTVASGTGCQLIACSPGDTQMVFNGQGTNALLVYPPSSTETIQGGSAGAGFSVAANKTAIFTKYTATVWGANLSA